MSFGIPPWEMSRVPLHYQEERRVVLQGLHKAKLEMQLQEFKSRNEFGAPTKFIPQHLPEF